MASRMFLRHAPRAPAFVRTRASEATAVWKGTLKEGTGVTTVGSQGIKDVPYNFPSRFENDTTKTNPEELIGASISSCYSMFVASLLTKEGLNPDSVTTVANVTLGEGPKIMKVELRNETKCNGVDAERFGEIAQQAKEGCPIANALAGVPEITLEAKLF